MFLVQLDILNRGHRGLSHETCLVPTLKRPIKLQSDMELALSYRGATQRVPVTMAQLKLRVQIVKQFGKHLALMLQEL